MGCKDIRIRKSEFEANSQILSKFLLSHTKKAKMSIYKISNVGPKRISEGNIKFKNCKYTSSITNL